MTRKDYIAIAGALWRTGNGIHETSKAAWQAAKNTQVSATMQIADVLASDNPRFDRARFLKACGVEA